MGKVDFFELVARRHSYRGGFKPTEIPREHLEKILDAGIRAPSAMNAQTTRFVIIDDKKLVESIHSFGANPAIISATAFIVCITDRHPKPVADGRDFQAEDCATAVENMLLAITALGYASVWTHRWLLDHNNDAIAKLINLPEEKAIRMFLPIGIPLEPPSQAPKLPFNQRAWFNSYGK
jgi:nitroreductase